MGTTPTNPGQPPIVPPGQPAPPGPLKPANPPPPIPATDGGGDYHFVEDEDE